MEEIRRSRFRRRIRTILVTIAILALMLAVAMQQRQLGRQRVEIERLRNVLESEMARTESLTMRLLEQQDLIERQRQLNSSSSQP
jgi:hypothetical protein